MLVLMLVLLLLLRSTKHITIHHTIIVITADAINPTTIAAAIVTITINTRTTKYSKGTTRIAKFITVGAVA